MAMTPLEPERALPTPSRRGLVVATFLSQLLGALVFALGVVWLVVLRDRTALTVTVLVLGAVHVFASGMAYRGSINSLGACAGLDVVLAFACITKPAFVKAFVLAPIAWARPALAGDLTFVLTIVGLVSLAAASACIGAVPQTRRFVAWRTQRLLIATRVWR
jgi:hypothetical protein